MFTQIKKAANAVAESMTDAVSAGFDKLQAPLNDLAATSDSLATIGYRLGDVELELTIPPRIAVHLHREKRVHDEAFQGVLANNQGNRTLCTVVRLLWQTNRVIDRMPLKGRQLHEVEIGLGLIPSVKLKYESAKEQPAEAPPS
jgi:hypothetical protein